MCDSAVWRRVASRFGKVIDLESIMAVNDGAGKPGQRKSREVHINQSAAETWREARALSARDAV